MKKITFLVLFLISAITVVNGQPMKDDKSQPNETKKETKTERVALKNLKGTEVSSMAINSFERDFGNIPDVKWKRSGPFDEALFTRNGKEETAFYDIDGTLVGTCKHVTFAELPSKGQKEINSRYKDYTVGPCIYYEDSDLSNTDMVMYGTQFDDADSYFAELTKGTDKIVVKIEVSGIVSFFKQL